MTTFTRTSPTGGLLPAGVTEIGGLVLDIVGTNGVRVVSQLAASALYVGFFDSGSPTEFRGNPGTIGIQTGLASPLTALGGEIESISVRVTLFDGDTGDGDFDENVNFLLLNGIEFGNFSGVVTQQTSPDGTTILASDVNGFVDDRLHTGFFSVSDSGVLKQIYDSIVSTGQVVFQLRDDRSVYDNYFDFKQGVDGGLVDVGTPPNVSPVAGDDEATTDEDTPVVIDVGLDDFDPDGTIVSYSYMQPSNGTVTGSGSSVTYTPDAGFTGTDTFTYTVTDNAGATGTATVTVTVGGGEPPVSPCPTINRDGTQDGSNSSNQTLTGPAYHNSFYFDNAVGGTGDDEIANFAADDILVVTKALEDRNGDGVINFGSNGVLDLGGGNSVDFANGVTSLRFLGEACEGNFVYADARVRPDGATEGLVLSNDVLEGDAADSEAEIFFFDTALDLDLGDDTITNFGSGDVLVTTTQIRDNNGDGIVGFGPNAVLDLPGGVGGPGDPGMAGEGGAVTVTGPSGESIEALEYDGSVTRDGVTYYVYSIVGSAVGVEAVS